MQRPANLAKYLPDNFMLLMILTVITASFLPCYGAGAQVFNGITNVAICLLFFLHGAKLSREAVIAGVTHWRLHLAVLACTFVLLPLFGLLLKPLGAWLVTPELYLGVMFVCVLPSTVQSSIAFTAVARGNVPAAVCAASLSNMLGVFITPVLAGLLVIQHAEGSTSFTSIGNIALQLLLPFVLGQFARRWIGARVERAKTLVKAVDQGAILLVVYTAFSEAVNQGMWHALPWHALLGLLIIDGILLALIMVSSTLLSRRLGLSKEDEITILFCGSKKSLASGVPMAKILFAGKMLGAVVLPLMLFHQLQLMISAILAQRYARRAEAAAASAHTP